MSDELHVVLGNTCCEIINATNSGIGAKTQCATISGKTIMVMVIINYKIDGVMSNGTGVSTCFFADGVYGSDNRVESNKLAGIIDVYDPQSATEIIELTMKMIHKFRVFVASTIMKRYPKTIPDEILVEKILAITEGSTDGYINNKKKVLLSSVPCRDDLLKKAQEILAK